MSPSPHPRQGLIPSALVGVTVDDVIVVYLRFLQRRDGRWCVLEGNSIAVKKLLEVLLVLDPREIEHVVLVITAILFTSCSTSLLVC